MCETMYTKTKQELEVLKVAKGVIAKVFQSYANVASTAQKTSSASKNETSVNHIDELIAKCSTEVTEEVANGHLTYELAIHTMTAVGMVLTGRTKDFVIPRDTVVSYTSGSTTYSSLDVEKDIPEEEK